MNSTKRIVYLLIAIIMASLVGIVARADAYNLLTDIETNTTFPIGQAASAGTAINLRTGETSTSMLAEIAVYRNMLALSYGGTRVNTADANFTDTAKIGLNLSWVFSHFTNALPAQAQFLQNINIGPSFAMNLISGPRKGTPFFDLTYIFGNGGTAPVPAPPVPTVTPASPMTPAGAPVPPGPLTP